MFHVTSVIGVGKKGGRLGARSGNDLSNVHWELGGSKQITGKNTNAV